MAGYPIILGGDHAAFEIEHMNTPPQERPDWPLPSFDARDWAAAFCKIAKTHGHDLDEGWMTTWFANALMRGFDEATAQGKNKDEIHDRLDRLDAAVLEINPGLNWS